MKAKWKEQGNAENLPAKRTEMTVRTAVGTTAGTTMVEIMVGFFILVAIMAVFSQVFSLTGKMCLRSENSIKNNAQLEGDYYLGNVSTEVLQDFHTITLKRDGTTDQNSKFTISDIRIQKNSSTDATVSGTIYDVVKKP